MTATEAMSQTPTERRAKCNPALIGRLTGAGAPLVGTVYGIRQRNGCSEQSRVPFDVGTRPNRTSREATEHNGNTPSNSLQVFFSVPLLSFRKGSTGKAASHYLTVANRRNKDNEVSELNEQTTKSANRLNRDKTTSTQQSNAQATPRRRSDP